MKANGVLAIRPADTPPAIPASIELLKDAVNIPGATDAELRHFGHVASAMGLDPLKREIYMVKRWNPNLQRETCTHQVGIDGFRRIAERTGKYLGQTPPQWCGSDGKWMEVWLDETLPPAAARAGIYRADFREPIYAVARFCEYVQLTKDRRPVPMWLKMPSNQLVKCAEALALRKAFPNELGGVYTAEEMGQAANPDANISDATIPPSKKMAESSSAIPPIVQKSQTVSPPELEMGIPDIVANLQPFERVLGTKYYSQILREIGGAEHPNKVPLEKARKCWKYFDACLRVREFSERIGSDEYRRILRAHGYETPQQIPALEEFAAILRLMKAAEAAQGAAK